MEFTWWGDLKGRVGRHRFVTGFLLLVVGVGAAGRFLGGVQRIRDLLSWLMLGAVTVDPPGAKVAIKGGYVVGALFFLVLAVLFVGFALQWRYDLRALRTTIERRGKTVEKTFEKMMLAASQVLDQLYPTARRPQKNLLSVRRTYLVAENLDTTVKREDEYQAITDLHIEHIRVGAEPAAVACEFLDDIDFKVRADSAANRVVYIPTKNTPYEKSVVLFFLPHISPGEKRKIVITYKWPRMLRQLETKGFELGQHTFKSQNPIPEVEIRLFFAPRLRRRILVQIHGARIDGDSIVPADCDVPGYAGWGGWSYNLKDAPGGTYRLRIELDRENQPSSV